MTRHEKRIKNIRKRITQIDREIEKLPPAKPFQTALNRKLNKLYDRRDSWEERLVQAELGTPQIYSRGAAA